MNKSDYAQLAKYLRKRSKEICHDNGCTEDDHHCESYAYISRKDGLLDICCPDYFQGYRHAYAAVGLPFTGFGPDLCDEVMNQIDEQEEVEA